MNNQSSVSGFNADYRTVAEWAHNWSSCGYNASGVLDALSSLQCEESLFYADEVKFYNKYFEREGYYVELWLVMCKAVELIRGAQL